MNDKAKQYICRVSYKGISRNDIVEVKHGRYQDYITFDKMVYGVNDFIIEQHFERLEEK